MIAVATKPRPKVNLPRNVLLDVKSVKVAPYNPPGRTEKSRLRSLLESVKEVGLLYPILVDHDHRIIDGHRRLAVVTALGWDQIPAMVVSGEKRDQLYASVNVCARKMGGNEALTVWLHTPGAVAAKLNVQFCHMQDVLGRELVMRARNEGYSQSTFKVARQLSFYCDQRTPAFIKEAFVWLLDNATAGQVFKAMQSGEPTKVFLDAIRRKKPVKLRLTVAEDGPG